MASNGPTGRLVMVYNRADFRTEGSMLPFDLAEVIKAVGYVGLFAIVFAESGLFFGFFLPGDSLLFTAGFAAPPRASSTSGS